MQTMIFKDFEEFANEINKKLDNIEDCGDISVIAKYDEAKEIIKNFVCLDYDLAGIDIHDYDYDFYKDEYIISLTKFDGVKEIWCEPMRRENGYIDDESDFIYVMGNCSSKVLKHLKGKKIYETTVGVDEDYGCDECECTCKKDVKSTTTSKSATYKINNKEVSKEEFDKKYEEFEEMYLDNIREHRKFIDEINEWMKKIDSLVIK